MENQHSFEQQNNIINAHVQMGGQAYYDAHSEVQSDGSRRRHYFMFTPDDPRMDQVARFRGLGVAQQMPDGTFDFVYKPKQHPRSKLIKKLAHGRASLTLDGAIQLTLKVFCNEGINISEAIDREAKEAVEAIRDFQLKH